MLLNGRYVKDSEIKFFCEGKDGVGVYAEITTLDNQIVKIHCSREDRMAAILQLELSMRGNRTERNAIEEREGI